MEIKRFKTLVKNTQNSYILGRISGIMIVLCDMPHRDDTNLWGYPIAYLEDGVVLRTDTTFEEYIHFAEVIEKHYPGLCEFYYDE